MLVTPRTCSQKGSTTIFSFQFALYVLFNQRGNLVINQESHVPVTCSYCCGIVMTVSAVAKDVSITMKNHLLFL